jgi:hypothetical protein
MKLPANGVEGHLLYVGEDDEGGTGYVFRVYTDSGEFTDYDLCHTDLCVTITDQDATFYSDDNGNRLNHSPKTLGVEEQRHPK